MRNLYIILFISVVSINSYAQIKYEPGYFINNDGQKIECLIKNRGWKNVPTKFNYKLSENEEPQEATIKTVKEFGFSDHLKFTRQTVNIDRSSDDDENLSTVREPIFKEEKLFLKVLVEGKANLYWFQDKASLRYFYKTDDSAIKQLIYKKYKRPVLDDEEPIYNFYYKSSSHVVVENNLYKQQLLNDLKCQDVSKKSIESLEYRKTALVTLFVKYNECKEWKVVLYEKKAKGLFNLTPRASLSKSTLSIQNETIRASAEFNTEVGFKFGIEAEFIMPFNRNKWAFIIEPTYQYYNPEIVLLSYQGAVIPFEKTVEVDYKSIELPIGVRHYIYLNDKSKIFLNISYVYDFTISSKVDHETREDLDFETGNNLAFGLGYNYNFKYNLELRYATNRNILANYVYWQSEYKSLSIVFGYTIF